MAGAITQGSRLSFGGAPSKEGEGGPNEAGREPGLTENAGPRPTPSIGGTKKAGAKGATPDSQARDLTQAEGASAALTPTHGPASKRVECERGRRVAVYLCTVIGGPLPPK